MKKENGDIWSYKRAYEMQWYMWMELKIEQNSHNVRTSNEDTVPRVRVGREVELVSAESRCKNVKSLRPEHIYIIRCVYCEFAGKANGKNVKVNHDWVLLSIQGTCYLFVKQNVWGVLGIRSRARAGGVVITALGTTGPGAFRFSLGSNFIRVHSYHISYTGGSQSSSPLLSKLKSVDKWKHWLSIQMCVPYFYQLPL